MWPSEMKELPPETSAESRQQVVRNQSQLRAMNFKFTVALCAVILGLLTIVLHTGFNPMLRPLVMLLGVVGAVSLFLRSQITADRPRPFDSLEQIRGASPEGAKKVYDVKDLPPELAANPEVRKLFEWAKAQGVSLKIGRRDQLTGLQSQSPETVKVGVGFGEPGHLQVQVGRMRVGGVEEMAPPELAASSEVQKLFAFVESRGLLPTDLQRMENLGTPLSAKLISILSRTVTWASLIVIFAALAVAAVALWSLNGAPRPH
jgi:hypothetical protein